MKIEQMGESSIVRSDYKFVKFKDSWHTGLLYKFVSPPCQQSSLYRIGRVLHQACNILLRSFYGLILVALRFCLIEEKTAVSGPCYHLCVSQILEIDRFGE